MLTAREFLDNEPPASGKGLTLFKRSIKPTGYSKWLVTPEWIAIVRMSVDKSSSDLKRNIELVSLQKNKNELFLPADEFKNLVKAPGNCLAGLTNKGVVVIWDPVSDSDSKEKRFYFKNKLIDEIKPDWHRLIFSPDGKYFVISNYMPTNNFFKIKNCYLICDYNEGRWALYTDIPNDFDFVTNDRFVSTSREDCSQLITYQINLDLSYVVVDTYTFKQEQSERYRPSIGVLFPFPHYNLLAVCKHGYPGPVTFLKLKNGCISELVKTYNFNLLWEVSGNYLIGFGIGNYQLIHASTVPAEPFDTGLPRKFESHFLSLCGGLEFIIAYENFFGAIQIFDKELLKKIQEEISSITGIPKGVANIITDYVSSPIVEKENSGPSIEYRP